jgi:RHS repeat-associated protein
LPTEFASDGAIKGKVTQGFNSDFRLNSQTINGEHRVSYLYDADGLPSVAGSVEFERDDGNGRITGTRLSGISTEQGYNDFGELNRFVASVKDNEVFAVRYERDPLGRIEKLTETIEGRTTTFGYKYDDADRLTDVSKDGLNTAHYEYDLNGNRLVSQGSKGKKSGRYDDQDRLLEFGETTWTHTARGDWASKAANGKTTRYDYDPMGNLRAVTLPEGTGIEYLIDPADRRIGKKVNGKLVQGFLYMDRLRPVAELDGEGKIVSRFVYATRINIPDYMMRGGETYRIITDHLGSPRLVIDAIRGTIAQRIDYDEFGNVLSDTNPGFQPFGFAGGLYDRDTKLVRFGARDYDAETGRWTAEEPLNFGGGAVNLYAYAYHDPVNWFDASGAKPVGSNIVNYGNGWVGGPAENRTFWRAKASPNLLPEAARVPPSLKGGARASGVITNPTQLRSLTSGGGGLCPSPKGGGGGGGGGFAALAWLAVDELERVANEIAYEHYAPKLLKMYTFEPLKTPIPVVPQLRIYTVPPWFTHFWK